ncbi:tail fiber assembly protein [Scandinavium sp. TWS1a]|uniref:tail fiber assembly protein n=1 Tax=Scandinavium tedordense TaxID=2926521 RepID=UPI00216570CA|nr:tail fiber assembly protein [Scandinavium tedordense]MCS2172249.1 tail fiber assembly protein [Scandinavium tedordense]
MSEYYFSPSENAFYPVSLRDLYNEAGTWPADGVVISGTKYTEFSGAPPKGKVRVVGEDGFPAWDDIPPPTPQEEMVAAETQKQSLIDQANSYINSKQWPGKAALGRLTDAEKEQYNVWLDYLDALEAMDTSSAPDINWPGAPEV